MTSGQERQMRTLEERVSALEEVMKVKRFEHPSFTPELNGRINRHLRETNSATPYANSALTEAQNNHVNEEIAKFVARVKREAIPVVTQQDKEDVTAQSIASLSQAVGILMQKFEAMSKPPEHVFEKREPLEHSVDTGSAE